MGPQHIPLELWREIFLQMFEPEEKKPYSSSTSLQDILDTSPQNCHDQLPITQYLFICKYFAPIIEECLYRRVYVQACHWDTFISTAVSKSGISGLTKRGRFTRTITVYDQDGLYIDVSHLQSIFPKLKSLGIHGSDGACVEEIFGGPPTPTKENILGLYLHLDHLNWKQLQMTTLHFCRLTQLHIARWTDDYENIDTNDTITFPHLEYLRVCEAFISRGRPEILKMPALLHLSAECPEPRFTSRFQSFLTINGSRLRTLDLRTRHMSVLHTSPRRLMANLGCCPQVETLVIPYPPSHSTLLHFKYPLQKIIQNPGNHLRQIIIYGLNRGSDMRYLSEIGQHADKCRHPKLEVVSLVFTPFEGEWTRKRFLKAAKKQFSREVKIEEWFTFKPETHY